MIKRGLSVETGAKLTACLDLAADALVLLDGGWHILYANPALALLLLVHDPGGRQRQPAQPLNAGSGPESLPGTCLRSGRHDSLLPRLR